MHAVGWTPLSPGFSDHEPTCHRSSVRPPQAGCDAGTGSGPARGRLGKVVRDALPTVHPSPCPPVEDGPDTGTVRAVPMHVEPGG